MAHEATKQTPYEYHHGKKPKLPQIRNMINIPPQEECEDMDAQTEKDVEQQRQNYQ